VLPEPVVAELGQDEYFDVVVDLIGGLDEVETLVVGHVERGAAVDLADEVARLHSGQVGWRLVVDDAHAKVVGD